MREWEREEGKEGRGERRGKSQAIKQEATVQLAEWDKLSLGMGIDHINFKIVYEYIYESPNL